MIWLVLSAVALAAFYYWSTNTFRHWKKKGIYCAKAYPLLGSYPSNLLMRRPLFESQKQLYKDFKEHEVGVYFALKAPIVLLTSPELIREVAIKNFDHFTARKGVDLVREVHPEVAKMITSLEGEEWKVMRSALSPAFTTGKMRGVVGAMNAGGPQFSEFLLKELEKPDSNGVIELREAFGRYTMGIISHAVFGVDARVYEEEQSEFVKNARKVQSRLTLKFLIRFLFFVVAPKLAKAMKVGIVDREPVAFFYDVTKRVLDMRREDKKRANDMLQVFLDIRGDTSTENSSKEDDAETDQFEADAKMNVECDPKKLMDDDAIVQSSILFLVAGFDTTANTLSLVAYHLATNPQVQAKARDEVDEVFRDLELDDNGEPILTYEAVSKLEYVEMVIDETLRITAIAPVTERVCSRDFVLSNGVKIEKGTRMHIPIIGFHTDEKYWPEPEEFRPERFSRENKKNIVPYTYLPFGIGPRNCIGMRFALLETKVAVFHLLRKFEIEPSEKTTVPPKFDKTLALTVIAGGNHLKLVPRSG